MLISESLVLNLQIGTTFSTINVSLSQSRKSWCPRNRYQVYQSVTQNLLLYKIENRES